MVSLTKKSEDSGQNSTDARERITRRGVLRATTIAAIGSVGISLMSGTAAAGGCLSGMLGRPSGYPFVYYGDEYGDFPWGADEIAFFVHGWQEEIGGDGRNQAYTCQVALRNNGYYAPTACVYYNSNTLNWYEAKDEAEVAGRSFADWLDKYLSWYPDTTIRLIAHSLGARVTLTALNELANRGHEITTVSLLGGAVDAVEIGGRWEYGIYHASQWTHNYHSDNDQVLDDAYWLAEWDEAAGEDGAQGPVPPRNYTDHNVTGIIHAHCNYFKPHQGCIRQVVNDL